MTVEEIGELAEASGIVQFDWQIEDFFSYSQANVCYSSPEIWMLDLKWQMKIYPNGCTEVESVGNVSLYIKRVDVHMSIFVEFELAIGIRAVNGDVYNKYRVPWTSTFVGTGWHKFIDRHKLESEKLLLVPSDILTISCAIILKQTTPVTEIKMKRLAIDYKDMFISGKYCDASIKVKEVTFPVHKCVLAARSPVFAAMFENEMSEKQTGIANITDCDSEVFRDFLLYLYSGKLDFSKCSIPDLYQIADKYDVPTLKLECINFMINRLTVKNVCESYILGHQFNESGLMNRVETFFSRNFKKIVCSSEWITLLQEHCLLANDLLLKMSQNAKIELYANNARRSF